MAERELLAGRYYISLAQTQTREVESHHMGTNVGD